MSSSSSSYRLAIPKHLQPTLTQLVPGGLRQGDLEGLRPVLETPSLGLSIGSGLRAYAFKVERLPLVLHLAVTYSVHPQQRLIILEHAEYFGTGDDGEDGEE